MPTQVGLGDNRIYHLELPVSDDQIWSHPSLNKEEFFAALYHLQGHTQAHSDGLVPKKI